MYAIFQIGNKQYRVVEGQIINIDRINIGIGNNFVFDQVLLVKKNNYVEIGCPFIKNRKINIQVISNGLYPKVKIVKFNRRKHFKKTQGHRQHFTKIKIVSF